MKRLYLMILALLTLVGGVNAKTLWEGTDDGSDIEIAKSDLLAGTPITLEFNWLASDGAQFSCFYWNGNDWSRIYNWEWVNNGDSFTFSLTEDQLSAIPNDKPLCFKTETLAKMTFKKISMYKPSVSVTIGADEVATFSSAKKLDFKDTGISVYYASAVANGSVTLTKVENNTTWDYQGYILKGAAGTYTIPVTASATYQNTDYLQAHVSEGSVGASTEETYRYIFAKDKSDNGKIAFFKLTSNYTLAAHRAYLETEVTPGARLVLRFEDEDDPTAIGEVKSAAQPVKADNVYYNLNGQRVEKPTKGIYILNGKKVLF